MRDRPWTRRQFLWVALAAPLPLALAQPSPTLPATPACGDEDDELTPPQTEGPYFKPQSPERRSLLEPGLGGTRLLVQGYVLSTGCKPVARALLDFWQCDAQGQYDNQGFRLRGHQFSDASGRFALETVVPGLYPGRTRHIHVKVQAPGRPVLTSQLYFPGEPANASDRIFDRRLTMAVQKSNTLWQARFDFVLQV